jgi:hypothetical protein
MCHAYCDTKLLFLKANPKDPGFSLLNATHLAKEQLLLMVINVLGWTRLERAGLELTTSRMLSNYYAND